MGNVCCCTTPCANWKEETLEDYYQRHGKTNASLVDSNNDFQLRLLKKFQLSLEGCPNTKLMVKKKQQMVLEFANFLFEFCRGLPVLLLQPVNPPVRCTLTLEATPYCLVLSSADGKHKQPLYDVLRICYKPIDLRRLSIPYEPRLAGRRAAILLRSLKALCIQFESQRDVLYFVETIHILLNSLQFYKIVAQEQKEYNKFRVTSMELCEPNAAFFGFMGVTCAVVFSNLGAAYGTAKAGVGIASMGVMRPDLVMRSTLPVVMAAVLGIYGLVMGNFIRQAIANNDKTYSYYLAYSHLGCGLTVGLSSLASGLCIGIAGDAGVRAIAQQPRLFIGVLLILIFAEALGLYGFIIGILIYQDEKTGHCKSFAE